MQGLAFSLIPRSTGLEEIIAKTKAFAEADKHEQRTNTPRNPEHRQKSAQLVGPHGAKNLAECIGKCLHDFFDAPMDAWKGIRKGREFGSHQRSRVFFAS